MIELIESWHSIQFNIEASLNDLQACLPQVIVHETLLSIISGVMETLASVKPVVILLAFFTFLTVPMLSTSPIFSVVGNGVSDRFIPGVVDGTESVQLSVYRFLLPSLNIW